jgi:peptidyl-prolyl cis-trans isomerase SurA
MTDPIPARRRGAPGALAALALGLAALAPLPAPAQTGDYIVAVVNQELVTAAEVQQRIARVRAEAQQTRTQLPPPAALRQQVVDVLIDERVLVTNARDSGMKIDEAELDRAVANVALQNQLTLPQLRERLRREGIDYAKFRSNVKDQMMVERMREREVASRIRVTDAEIDNLLEERRAGGANAQFNIAQILVHGARERDPGRPRPSGASARSPRCAGSRRRGLRRGRARGLAGRQSRRRRRDRMRPSTGCPTSSSRRSAAQAGDVSPDLLRSAAGYHVLKLLERKDEARSASSRCAPATSCCGPRPRSPATRRRAASASSGATSSPAQDLRAARPRELRGRERRAGRRPRLGLGRRVRARVRGGARPLDVGGISEPVVTRFGVHLSRSVDRRQVTLDAKQQREQAANILREQKFEEAYAEWLRDLRGRAYIEMREPPQ